MKSRLVLLSRLAALALLVCIGVDVAADAGCDPVFMASTQPELKEDTQSTEECGAFCVPDCFCCSTLIAYGLAVQVEAIGSVDTGQHRPYERQLDGVSALVFHPPLRHA